MLKRDGSNVAIAGDVISFLHLILLFDIGRCVSVFVRRFIEKTPPLIGSLPVGSPTRSVRAGVSSFLGDR